MPKVPEYGGPQVRSAGLPGPSTQTNISADMLSGDARALQTQGRELSAAGRAAGDAGDTFDKIAQREDNDVAWRTEAEIKSKWLDFEGQLQKQSQGRNAVGYTQKVTDWWSTAGKDYSQQLTPSQQQLINKNLVAAALQAKAGAVSFEDTHRRASEAAAYKSANDVDVNNAANLGTPEAAQLAKELTAKRRLEYGATAGWTPEQVKADEIQSNTILHTAMVQKLIQTDPMKAGAYLDAAKAAGDIDSKVATSLQAHVQQATDLAEGGNKAREVWSTYMTGKSYNDPVPTDKMDAELVRSYSNNPTRLQAARHELDRQAATFNNAQKEAEAGAINKVYTQLNAKAPLSQVMLGTDWQSLSSTSQRKIEQDETDRQHALWARSLEDRVRLEHLKTLETAPALFMYSQPDALASMSQADVMNLAPTIGYDNAAKLMHTWNTYQKDTAKLSEAKIDNDTFNSMATTAGFDVSRAHKDGSVAAPLQRMRNEIESIIGQRQVKEKRELLRDEKEKIMQDTIDNTVKTGWLSSAVPQASLDPKGKTDAYTTVQVGNNYFKTTVNAKDISAAERTTIIEVLRRNGLPRTEENIARFWATRQDDLANKKGK